MVRNFLLRTALLLSAGILNACSIVDHRNDVSYGKTGELVSSELVAQIKPGKTRKAWILSHLGEPSDSTSSVKGEELLTYTYETIAQKRLRVIFLFQTRSTKVDNKHLYISLKNGLVTRCWKSFSYAAATPVEEPEDIR